MLKVGITGGIGSGKTTICKMFEVFGIPVFYADEAAKTMMNTDEQLKAGIIKAFGKNAYSGTGQLNRKYIASIVFNDEEELKTLNSLVHPAVFRAFDHWVILQADAKYVVKEAALLFESEFYKKCGHTVLVKSPEDLRIERVTERDGISAAEVKLRMNRQFTDAQKEKLADHTIINDEKTLLIPQVLSLHRLFLSLAK